MCLEKHLTCRDDGAGMRQMMVKSIKVNRAPVLTLWGAVVAERLGFDRDEALTLALPDVERAMRTLAWALPPEELARRAFELYEHFRPEVPPGRRGWGAAGTLDLNLIVTLARAARTTRTRGRREVGRRSHWTAPESRVSTPG